MAGALNFARWGALACAAALAACASQPQQAAPPAQPETPAAAPAAINIPIEYYRLGNGLKVVLSRDATAPTVTVGVYYHIGFRIEPQGRTGFAHLFEHLMFQGSGNLGKMEFIRLVEGNGGVLNGSTRFDFTNYYQIVPAHVLETVLWAESDRMKALAITQANLENQQGVVKNEVRDNVMNQPYGGFPWLTMPQVANSNWYNAHNFYGDLADLDAATLADAQAFFDTYYAPNNAVLVIAGDFDTTAARAWVERYFGSLPARAQPARPDLAEPVRSAEKRDTYVDRLAPRPALALAWQVPERGTPEHYAFSLLDTILLQGEDSRLWQKLVKERGYSGSVGGGINLLGNEFTYDGPMLWMIYLIHDPGATPEAIIADIGTEIARIQAEPPTQEELARALTKLRASLYDLAGSSTRFGLVDLLASFALFDDDPARINRLEDNFRAVTPELISAVARTYLTPERRTVQVVQPGRAQLPAAGGAAVKPVIAILAALAALPVAAQPRELPPAPATPHEFKLPARETLRLDNGLAITFIDYGSVPKVALVAVVRTGNIDEGRDTWLADVTAEMLKEGTTSRSAADIARAAAGMGGALSVGAGAEQTSASISVLSEHAGDAALLLADVLQNPLFPESELPRVLANFERSLAVSRSDPQSLADETLARLVFGDHPFGRMLPQDGQLAGYDMSKLRGFFDRNFGARRTHVYVAGRYDRPALEAALRRGFQGWRAGEAPSDLPARASETLQLALVDSPGAPQSSVRIAVPVPDPSHPLWFQASLMNSLLGGTFGSRITTNLREDKGYSYSPDSSINPRRGGAMWVLSAEVTAEHTAAALTEIFREIERLQREAPADAELDPVKNYRAGVFVISNSSPTGVLGQLAFMDLHGLPDDFLTRWVANIRAVTPAQVSEMAREFIRTERMTVVVAGDVAKVGAIVQALPQFTRARMP